MYTSKLGISVGIHQGFNRRVAFAKRTVAALIRCVARNVVRGENIMDGNTVHVRNGTKYGAYAFEIAAVILNAFHAAANAEAGRHGRHEEHDVLLVHHGLDIFSKEHLTIVCTFWTDDVNLFVLGSGYLFLQFDREKRTNNTGSVQTNDGINGIHILVLACQRVCTFLCILLAGFQHGQINKVIDMGMTCDEMTGNGLNRYDVAKFIGAELNRSGVQLFHDNPFFLFGIAAVVRFLSFSIRFFSWRDLPFYG